MSGTTSLSEFPLAYLLTFTTYGSWLHGEEKGSVDRQHNRVESDLVPADQRRKEAMSERLKNPAVSFSEPQRKSVEQSITDVCEHRNWELLAINVRTNHVHVVVATTTKPEKVMTDFKSWATRRLRESKLMDDYGKVWSRHGSTRYLWDDRAVEDACQYVVEGQGVKLT